MADFHVVRDWQARGVCWANVEEDRWLAHELAEAEAEAARLLSRAPRAWAVASIRFGVTDPIHVYTDGTADPLPPAPPREEHRRDRARKGPNKQRASAPHPGAYRTAVTPVVGGGRYYDDVIAELKTCPGEWVIVATDQGNGGIAQWLRNKGCEATTRSTRGRFTIYARWDPRDH